MTWMSTAAVVEPSDEGGDSPADLAAAFTHAPVATRHSAVIRDSALTACNARTRASCVGAAAHSFAAAVKVAEALRKAFIAGPASSDAAASASDPGVLACATDASPRHKIVVMGSCPRRSVAKGGAHGPPAA